MSMIAKAGAYAYQKRQVAALEDAETRAQMGLDVDGWTAQDADRPLPDAEDEAGMPAEFHRPGQGDERVLAAARAL